MKIALLIPQLALGGAEVDMVGMANQLMTQHEVQVYCLNPYGELKSRLKAPIANLPAQIPEEFDMVIVMGPDAFAGQISSYRGTLVNYVCNITPGYYSKEIAAKYYFTAIMVDSKNCEDHVRAISPDADIWNGWYFMAEPKVLQTGGNYERWGINEHNPVVGTLCAHRLVKKIPRLMEAFKSSDISESALFLIAGSGPETQNWKQYASYIGISHKVKFVGVVLPEDLGEFYGCCNVFINQYVDFAGGRCLTTSEAAGAGCYIITNEHGGAKENILAGNGIVINDDVFDSKAPSAITSHFLNSISLSEMAKAEYIIRHAEQDKICEWVKKYDKSR